MPFWAFSQIVEIKNDFDHRKSVIKYELNPSINWKNRKYIKGNLLNTFFDYSEPFSDYPGNYDFNEKTNKNSTIDQIIKNIDIPNYELSYYNKKYNVSVNQKKYTNKNEYFKFWNIF